MILIMNSLHINLPIRNSTKSAFGFSSDGPFLLLMFPLFETADKKLNANLSVRVLTEPKCLIVNNENITGLPTMHRGNFGVL